MTEKGKPCKFVYHDEEKGDTPMKKADVICDRHCGRCGFNPAEQERRLKDGHFVKDAAVIITLFADGDDRKGRAAAYGNLKQLRFPALTKKPSGGAA